MAINKGKVNQVTSYLVIGDKTTGKTSYIANKLAGVEHVLWISTLRSAQVDFDNVTIVDENDVTELLKDPSFPSYKHVVIDNASIFSDILLANINEKTQMQVYGVLGQRMVSYIQRLMKHGATIHATLSTRVVTDTKAVEIALSDKALSILYALTTNHVFVSHGRDPKTAATTFRAQEDSIKALKLQA